ncbi:unnamed protein product [Darwinula stevensoni]|uniref:Uncharacterized protein n=1 Tax=Darwinula stevensoni TaxID=69355 RepID=A0A7R9A8C9_9CRUS|nr:unnamed protein product [Darwinula stevensoni]CAG0896302.1 unnamed protein product [Darwinula stevensoni]
MDNCRLEDPAQVQHQQAAKEKCSSSKSCVTHSLCTGNDEDKTCSCFGGFVADDATGLCKIPSGGKCSSLALCVTHSICSENDGENKCSCFDDFVADDATGLCRKILLLIYVSPDALPFTPFRPRHGACTSPFTLARRTTFSAQTCPSKVEISGYSGHSWSIRSVPLDGAVHARGLNISQRGHSRLPTLHFSAERLESPLTSKQQRTNHFPKSW